MTIVIPDARTPAGVKCWVRDSDDEKWLLTTFSRTYGRQFWANASEPWNQCRIDDPVEGWVQNTGTAPDVQGPIDLKIDQDIVPYQKANMLSWATDIPKDARITHWRYTHEPRSPK